MFTFRPLRIDDLRPGDVIPAEASDVGLDFCIGLPALIGQGLGTILVHELVELSRWMFPTATGAIFHAHTIATTLLVGYWKRTGLFRPCGSAPLPLKTSRHW